MSLIFALYVAKLKAVCFLDGKSAHNAVQCAKNCYILPKIKNINFWMLILFVKTPISVVVFTFLRLRVEARTLPWQVLSFRLLCFMVVLINVLFAMLWRKNKYFIKNLVFINKKCLLCTYE